MRTARRIVVAREFAGPPRPEDFRVEEEQLPPLRDGQVLAQAVYLSVDAYQRAYRHMHKIGHTMIGHQVARVVESRAEEFPEGSLVVGYWGWRDLTVADVRSYAPYFLLPPMPAPDTDGLPLSLSLGALGMSGVAAYFGLLEVCDPQPGELLVVSSAAGAVGSLVAQIATMRGCQVIGLAGSDHKVEWLKNELGVAHAFNYKTTDVAEALQRVAPEGVDVYFDNVGGEVSSAVLGSMRHRGRVALSGFTAYYNQLSPPNVLEVHPVVIRKKLRVQGFMFTQWLDRWQEAVTQLAEWIQEGKLKYRETVTEGFLNAPHAFISLLEGDCVGKAVVKV